jgi:hypothetical protein
MVRFFSESEMISELVGIENDLSQILTKFHITIFSSELFHITISQTI